MNSLLFFLLRLVIVLLALPVALAFGCLAAVAVGCVAAVYFLFECLALLGRGPN